MPSKLVHSGPYQDKDFHNFVTSSTLPRHRWYYFKEGFSTSLVNEAISSFAKKNPKLKIYDPFTGSGTTLLTSSLQGHCAIGSEVNPFLKFVTDVKTSNLPWERSTFLKDLEKIIKKSSGGLFSDLEGFSTFSPTKDLEKWLFNTSVLRRFTSTFESINEYAHPSNYLIFRFSSLIAAMDCCNARRDGKGLRYKTNWKELAYSAKNFEKKFRNISLLIADDISRNPIPKGNKSKVILSDSRSLLESTKFKHENFDLVITSPPYLNSFDYTDVYRPELFLGGFVKDNNELRSLRLKTLRSHVQVEWDSEVTYQSTMINSYFNRIEKKKDLLWNARIPLMVKAYFDDIYSIFKSLKYRINRGGQIWLVVSTSSYCGVHIPVDLLIAEIGEELGYKLKGVHCLRYLRTSSQQFTQLNVHKPPLRESLIILQK